MEEIHEFISDMNAWSIRTFGGTDPVPALYHLIDEVKETIEAIESCDIGDNNEDVKYEFADCFMLLTHAALKQGIRFEVLFEYAKKKHIINQSRTWGKPNVNGVVKHIDK